MIRRKALPFGLVLGCDPRLRLAQHEKAVSRGVELLKTLMLAVQPGSGYARPLVTRVR